MTQRIGLSIVFTVLSVAAEAGELSWRQCTVARPLCVNAAKFLHGEPSGIKQLSVINREAISKDHEVVIFHHLQDDTFSLLAVHVATEQPVFLIDHLPSHRNRDYTYRIVPTTGDSLTVEGFGTTYGDGPVRKKYFLDLTKKKATAYEEVPASFSEIATYKGFVYFAGRQGEHGVIAKTRPNLNKLDEAEITTAIEQTPIEPILRIESAGAALRFVSENYFYDVSDGIRILPNPDKRKYKHQAADTAALGFGQLHSWVPQSKLEQYMVAVPASGGVVRFLAWNDETSTNSHGGEKRSGIYVSERNKAIFYPLPQPQNLDTSSSNQDKFEVTYRNEIGPIQLVGEKIWFGISFYDGEGYTGVGGIGTFDTKTRSYQIIDAPALKDFAASAILVDGDEVWLGLHGRPEGMEYASGVAKYQLNTRELKRFDVPGIAHKIFKHAGGVYIAASDRIAFISADRVLGSGHLERARDGRYRFRVETR